MSKAIEYTLAALEEATGVSARTIRYYISLGLVPAPFSGGRTAAYGDVHLQAILHVRDMKKQGCSLEDIKGKSPTPGVARVDPSWQVLWAGHDAMVLVRPDITVERRHEIEQAFRTGTRTLSEEG